MSQSFHLFICQNEVIPANLKKSLWAQMKAQDAKALKLKGTINV